MAARSVDHLGDECNRRGELLCDLCGNYGSMKDGSIRRCTIAEDAYVCFSSHVECGRFICDVCDRASTMILCMLTSSVLLAYFWTRETERACDFETLMEHMRRCTSWSPAFPEHVHECILAPAMPAPTHEVAPAEEAHPVLAECRAIDIFRRVSRAVSDLSLAIVRSPEVIVDEISALRSVALGCKMHCCVPIGQSTITMHAQTSKPMFAWTVQEMFDYVGDFVTSRRDHKRRVCAHAPPRFFRALAFRDTCATHRWCHGAGNMTTSSWEQGGNVTDGDEHLIM